jgi:SAM-dependent methyltransferase
MTQADPPILPFTGERFTPECVREIWYEHMHRYAFAAGFAAGRRVLDAACGEGYGSALMAHAGAKVLGVDIAQDSIDHARRRYAGVVGLSFAQGDVTRLDQYADASFDLITSFETLEHVAEQERMVAGFRRLLAPGGLLLISSPDKRTYSDLRGYQNEFHVRELYREQLEALLSAHFPALRLYAQKLLFQSLLWDPDCAPSVASAATLHDDASISRRLDYAALYFLAVCAEREADLPPVGGLHLFGDANESVYRHYDDEIRRHIAAGHRLIALEREIDDLRVRLARAETMLAEHASDQGRNHQ